MPEEDQQTKVVHVVIMATLNHSTGSIQQNIIGIFDNEDDAKNLEERFNAKDYKTKDAIAKAFRHRYRLPYFASSVKDLEEV